MRSTSRLLLASAVMLGAAMPLRATAEPEGQVMAVSLVPSNGRAELVIQIRGAVEVKDFTLGDPPRLVLDVKGATLASGGDVGYDGVSRGGVQNIKIRQFSPNVVRVVLNLDRIRDYRIERGAETIRVSFGTDQSFLAWSSTPTGELSAFAPSPAAPQSARRAPEVVPPKADRDLATPNAAEPRISVTWDRASIQEVVAGFAAVSGRTIIVGKDVKGEVSAEIKDKPWPLAFQAILAAQGLSAQEGPGGIIRVDAPKTLAEIDSLEPLETHVVRVNYARAAELGKSLEGILTKGRGKVIPDTASNSLILTDTKSRINSIVDFARGLDIRTPSVSIQAKLVFVDRTQTEQLGLKYDLGSSDQFFNKVVQRPDPTKANQPYLPGINIVNLGGNSLSAVGNADALVPSSALELMFSTAIGRFKLTSFLSALEKVELADVQAEPLTTTIDNKRAEILVGSETPVRIIDLSSGTGAGQPPRATVSFKTTGIRLTATPHVTNNRQVLMTISVERSDIRTVAAADLGFIIDIQKAETQQLVSDGETAVIGGLTVTTVTKARSGMPLLSSLPLIGSLFSFNSTVEERKDLIIMVTPRILDDSGVPEN